VPGWYTDVDGGLRRKTMLWVVDILGCPTHTPRYLKTPQKGVFFYPNPPQPSLYEGRVIGSEFLFFISCQLTTRSLDINSKAMALGYFYSSTK